MRDPEPRIDGPILLRVKAPGVWYYVDRVSVNVCVNAPHGFSSFRLTRRQLERMLRKLGAARKDRR